MHASLRRRVADYRPRAPSDPRHSPRAATSAARSPFDARFRAVLLARRPRRAASSQDQSVSNASYELAAVIFRHEKASTGHFTCAVQHAGKWFHLNDETVLSLDSFFLDSPLASLPSLVATTQKWQPAQLPQVTYSVYPRSFHNQSAALDDFRGTEPLLSEPANKTAQEAKPRSEARELHAVTPPTEPAGKMEAREASDSAGKMEMEGAKRGKTPRATSASGKMEREKEKKR